VNEALALRRIFIEGVQGLLNPPRNNIASLDVLRSLAILLVFSGHFAGEFGAPARMKTFPMVYFGWTGVDLFFVLSGLLIGMQLWKELQKTGRIRIPTFLLRRGLRIWPLYYSFVLLILAEGLLIHRNLSGVWSDVLFLSNYFHHQIGGGWSLSTEEQFYISIPILMLLLSRMAKLRHGWMLPVAWLTLLPVIRALTLRGSSANSAFRSDVFSPIHTHSDGLAFGVLLAWFVIVGPGILQMRTALKVLCAVLMIALAVGLYSLSRDIFNFTSLALIYGAATFYGVGLISSSAVLNWRGFYIISRLSYGVYLNHFGLLPIVVRWLSPLRAHGYLSFCIAYLLTFLFCLATAALTFLLIEWPFLWLRSRWLAAPKHARPATALPVGAP